MERNSLRRGTMLATAITALVLLAATFLIFAPPPPALGSSETPATPSSVSLSRADGTATASWPAVSGATKYHATYSTDGGGSWHAPVDGHTNITTTSITFNADNAKPYIVGLRAGNDNGQWSGWRNSPEAGPYTPPDANPPAAVGSITLNRSDATLTVSWNAVSGADKYHAVYQADGGDWLPPVPGHENITTTSFTFNIDNGKSYVVGVRAGNANGWGPWTDSPASHPPLPAAVGSITLNRSDATLTVSWNAVDGAANYHALYQADGAGDWLPPITDYQNITATGFTFDVDNNKSYVVGVRAGNSAGWGPWTDSPASGPYTPPTPTPTPTPEPEPPATPAGLTATPGDGSITLAWDDPGDSTITGYEYNVNHNDTSTGNLSGWSDWTALAGSGAATTSHTFTGLTNGKEYRYHLRAVNGGGHGAAAPNAAPWYVVAVPAVPLPAAPANLSVTPGDGYLDITWDAVSGATGYDVRAKTAGSSDWHDVASNITTTSHRYTTDATIDYVAVRARNANGPGNWTEKSRLPAHDWLNVVQQQGASINTSSLPPPPSLPAPASVTVTRDNGNNARSIGSEELTVTWEAVTGADGYNLICSSRSGWRWWHCGSVDSGSATTLKVTKGEHGKMSWLISYMVAVRSVTNNPAQASDWTRSVDAHPAHTPVKEQPGQNPISASRAAGSLTLSWIQPKYSTGYEIECATLENGVTSAYKLCADVETATLGSDRRVTATITQWTVDGSTVTVDHNKTYDLIVRTTNAWGKSPFHYAPLIYPITLTVSNVTWYTARLTLSNYPDDWWYRANTGPDNTCKGPVASSIKDLAGLSENENYTYSAYSDNRCEKVLVAAEEFTTRGLDVSNIAQTTATITLNGYAGDWYYQADSGPDATTCKGPISGATDVNLTGLTAGTPYYYRTYDNNTCLARAFGGNAKELAFAYFTTIETTLTASNVTDAGATLTIANHSGNWYYKHSGAGATCQGPVAGNSQNLTLTSGTYTYSAYSDSACKQGNLLATAAAFTTGQHHVSSLSSVKVGDSVIDSIFQEASAFTTGPNANGYTLTSVTLPLRVAAKTAGDPLVITLHQMEGSGGYGARSAPSDTVLATLSGTNPTGAKWADTTYTCSGSGCSLSASTTYFVVASVRKGEYAWAYTVTSPHPEPTYPANSGWDIGYSHSRQGGRAWTSYQDWHPVRIDFTTTQ